MGITNSEIARVFEDVADLLEIRGDNIHRVLSYRRAAESIAETGGDLETLAAEGKLEDIPGVGATIAEKIRELLASGRLEFYERLQSEVPATLLEIIRLNGVGPKKARLFWNELGITTVDALKKAAEDDKLAALPKMGAKSQQKILDSIAAYAAYSGRINLGQAYPLAERMLNSLLALPEAEKGLVAGSIRRGKPTIGDVDLLIASQHPQPIMEAFVQQDSVERVHGQGETKSSVEVRGGLQVDLRVLEPERWGTAVNYFTGSRAHNIRIREIALAQGWSLNEHALRPLTPESEPDPRPETHRLFAEEYDLYAFLGLSPIPPEIREDQGEIELAQEHALPTLITETDLHGDLHMHTTWSDGRLSIEELIAAAHRRGRRYIAITDHSRSLTVGNGLSIERLQEQRSAVRAAVAAYDGEIAVLHGAEVDILADGTLDYPDEILAELDIVIASLHSALDMPEDRMTERLLRAIANPHVDLIGHPTAQKIGQRGPVALDLEAVFAAAAHHQTALEINANPDRLDLSAIHARRAIGCGVLLVINTDAHSNTMMDHLHYGVTTARRGWVTAGSVINTWPIASLRAWLQSRTRPQDTADDDT
jgi:DNA polymerase (family X)